MTHAQPFNPRRVLEKSKYAIPSLLNSVFAGELGLPCARDHQPQHGGTDAAHLRRGPASNLHAHASGLVPAIRQLSAVSQAGTTAFPFPQGQCGLTVMLPLLRKEKDPRTTSFRRLPPTTLLSGEKEPKGGVGDGQGDECGTSAQEAQQLARYPRPAAPARSVAADMRT